VAELLRTAWRSVTGIVERVATEAAGRRDQLAGLLAQTANPEAPNEVNVSQPSDALTARAAAAGAFDSLFLGLGIVALIVGAVGVANTMIISVLERRSEIGLRRALGATKAQIRTQFLAESILLAVIGGITGVLAGAAATTVYASSKNWAIVIPTAAWSGGVIAAILIGAFAGLVPAVRASRLPPRWHCERHKQMGALSHSILSASPEQRHEDRLGILQSHPQVRRVLVIGRLTGPSHPRASTRRRANRSSPSPVNRFRRV
jgi:predicted lysophospholipase L1 biosynthesis ABC-type transport system permease subunit